ncbi:hypothetical protein IPM19_00415 [bacterium]|nr:MAG: hypothetical protein IPM19_00415 [bacterium]
MNKARYILVLLIALTLAPISLAKADEAQNRLPFIRMYNSKINDHFYTTSAAEANAAVSNHGYSIEGQLGFLSPVQESGTKPVIRMWNPRALKHFYTTSTAEEASAKASGFITEGIMGYIQHEMIGSGQSMPFVSENKWSLYRMYNGSASKHFYTINSGEMNSLLSRGYRMEGITGTLYRSNSDLRICPREWILNSMPGVVGSDFVPREYYIFDDGRDELFNYDNAWIAANCGITRQEVF